MATTVNPLRFAGIRPVAVGVPALPRWRRTVDAGLARVKVWGQPLRSLLRRRRVLLVLCALVVPFLSPRLSAQVNAAGVQVLLAVVLLDLTRERYSARPQLLPSDAPMTALLDWLRAAVERGPDEYGAAGAGIGRRSLRSHVFGSRRSAPSRGRRPEHGPHGVAAPGLLASGALDAYPVERGPAAPAGAVPAPRSPRPTVPEWLTRSALAVLEEPRERVVGDRDPRRERGRDQLDLKAGLSAFELEVFFQPIWDADGALVAADALLRWQHDQLGQIAPADFYPQVAKAGQLPCLLSYVLRAALRAWRDIEARHPGLDLVLRADLSVPVDDARLDLVGVILDQAGVDRARLVWDVAATQALEMPETFEAWRRACADRGFLVSLSNWPAGSSLLRALEMGPAEVKIDCRGKKGRRLRMADVRVAQDAGVRVVAAGLDSDDAVDRALGVQVDRVEGFALGRPANLAGFLAEHADGLSSVEKPVSVA